VVSCGIFANWPVEFGKICHGKLWALVIKHVIIVFVIVNLYLIPPVKRFWVKSKACSDYRASSGSTNMVLVKIDL